MHPHAPRGISQTERGAITITNLRVLMRQLEQRVRSQQSRIYELDVLVGHEKRELHEEIKRRRRDLRGLHARQMI